MVLSVSDKDNIPYRVSALEESAQNDRLSTEASIGDLRGRVKLVEDRQQTADRKMEKVDEKHSEILIAIETSKNINSSTISNLKLAVAVSIIMVLLGVASWLYIKLDDTRESMVAKFGNEVMKMRGDGR